MRRETLVIVMLAPVTVGSATLARDVEAWQIVQQNGNLLGQVAASLFVGNDTSGQPVSVDHAAWSAFSQNASNGSGSAIEAMNGEIGMAVSSQVMVEFGRSGGGSGGLDNPTFAVVTGNTPNLGSVNTSGGNGNTETLIPLPTPAALGAAGLALIVGVRRRRA